MAEIIDFAAHGKSTPANAPAYDISVLDAATAQVRAIELRIQTAEGSKCLLAMDAGDILKPINETIAHRKWGPFCNKCGLSVRTAQVYLQLAAARSTIEAGNAQRAAHLPPLSIREALKLISPKKPKQEPAAESEPVEDSVITVVEVLAWLSTNASSEDKRKIAVWLAQDTAEMRRMLPPKALPPKANPKQVYDKAMGLMTIDEAPTTPH
jgi:hypothetical protein